MKLSKEQIKEKQRVYREENKELIKANRRIWEVKNKERLDIYRSEYYKNNRDKILKQHKEDPKTKIKNKNYHASNRDEVLRKQKIYYRENIEKETQRAIDYRNKNRNTILNKQKEGRTVLSDYYVKSKLIRSGFESNDVTPLLISTKRELLKITRIIKQSQL